MDIAIAEKHVASEEYTGTVDMTRSGAAYIVTDQSEVDIFVHSKFQRSLPRGYGKSQSGKSSREEKT